MITLKKKYLLRILLSIVPVLISAGICSQPGVKARPNIVIILADDMGWGDVGTNGNPYGIHTPNMEKIANQGARFDRFLVSPLCAPTRASFLTGRYHLRTGVANVTGGLETMRSEEVTLGEVFKNAGYATGLFGKWHNGAHYPQDPNGQGFDEFFGFCAGHWTNYYNTHLQHNHEVVQTKGYITDVLTDAALGFIEKNKSRPFLCYIPYNAPHGPFQVDDKYFDKFKKRGVPDKEAAIYGMVENLDENIGRVLDKLTALHLSDQTIVLFATDNGPNSDRYNGGMKGKKGAVDEGGVRVPFFIRWPGKIPAHSLVTKIAAHIDILPTLVELTGIEKPLTLPLDGRSLAPLLQSKPGDWKERSIYTHVMKDTEKTMTPFPGAIRTSQYRYIRARETDQLYDMIKDPEQKTDIASQKPDLVGQFRNDYDQWFSMVTSKKIYPEITEIGYPQSPVTELFAPDAARTGSLKYFAKNGFAHDWFTGWQQPKDTAVWTLDVVEDGNYKIQLKYNCPDGFAGATMAVMIDGQKIEKPVGTPYTGKLFPSPDRVTRIEAFEKDWALMDVGNITLVKGRHRLYVERPSGHSEVPFELKSVIIEKL